MLTVSRFEGESVTIGENIVIWVTRIDGGRVRLSIDAPRDVLILRGELKQGGPPRKPTPPDIVVMREGDTQAPERGR